MAGLVLAPFLRRACFGFLRSAWVGPLVLGLGGLWFVLLARFLGVRFFSCRAARSPCRFVWAGVVCGLRCLLLAFCRVVRFVLFSCCLC